MVSHKELEEAVTLNPQPGVVSEFPLPIALRRSDEPVYGSADPAAGLGPAGGAAARQPASRRL